MRCRTKEIFFSQPCAILSVIILYVYGVEKYACNDVIYIKKKIVDYQKHRICMLSNVRVLVGWYVSGARL